MSTLLLIAEQFIIRFTLRVARKRRYNYRELLIVGTRRRATEIAQKIMKHEEWGLRIVGFVGKDPGMTGKEILGIKVIGTLNDIPNLIKEKVIDEVIFSIPKSWLGDLEPSIYACEKVGVKVKLTVNFFNPLIARYYLDDLDGIPLLTFSTTPQKAGQLLIKQIFDTIVSFLLLVLLLPLFLIVAPAIKISSPGPVFFKQRRCGLNRREFTFYKFRSMVADAEKIKTQLEKFNEADGPVFKIKNDPRITPIGKFIRKASIDELPQLFNVLKGDMSLVGPRPPLPSEVKKYERQQQRRLSMKPGITCSWQISGRSKVDFNTWMKMDLEYIDNWSLGLDFKILLKTIPAVLFGKGAM
jgi:exopolysaccharide biosynthesis polyprenyl glycosylphosphotransferase